MKVFHENAYSCDVKTFYYSRVRQEESSEYICHTCDSHLKKGKIPPQSVCNKLDIAFLPKEFSDLGKLEIVLASRRILFKKVLIMPRGQFPKLVGKICNVPLETRDVVDVLPRGNDSNSVLVLKLKRKQVYKNNIYYQSVRPHLVMSFLRFLKSNNPLYDDITINPENMTADLTASDDCDIDFVVSNMQSEIEQEIRSVLDFLVDTIEENLEGEENQNSHKLTQCETALVNETVTDEMVISPCEGKEPVPLYDDKFCEELSFPDLFPTGAYGYKVERDIPLTLTRYFNQRLLNYSQRFSSNSDYIFFAQMITQQEKIMSRINIAMKKVKGNLTAGEFRNNYDDIVTSLLRDKDAFKFLSEVKGSPAYWKNFLNQVLAMVRQLGLPTFFLTLSCADLRWDELVEIICRLENRDLSDEEIANMSYLDRCDILNKNPVLLARHFQYRVELFFKTILIDGPVGKTVYYAIRVEFQLRGSPHIHSFLWVLNAPTLKEDNIPQYIEFVDGIVKAVMPNRNEDPELFDLVKTFQIHSHSRSCQKRKNKKCRYSFGRFFTPKTIIAKPLSNSLDTEERDEIMKEKATVLNRVSEYINTNLDPRKNNLYEDGHTVPTIQQILNSLEITLDKYLWALSISSTNDFEIHYKRPPDSCFVNNYFIDGLKAWKANLDIQPVLTSYGAVNYLCSYLSKQEDEVSLAMAEAAREAKESNASKFEQMKKIARAYTTHREISVQEAVYHILPELNLRKIFPKVEFANTNMEADRIKLCLPKKNLEYLDENSTEICHKSNLDRYVLRPASVEELCYAQFLANYDKDSKPTFSDSQPEELNDELMNANHEVSQVSLPKKLKLSNNEIMRLRKVKKVLQIHQPNQVKFPEKYAHHILMLYKPFRKEQDLATDGSYDATLQNDEVKVLINKNKTEFEPNADLVETALADYRQVLRQDPILDHEDEETENILQHQDGIQSQNDENDRLSELDNASYGPATTPSSLPTVDINEKIRSLNGQQREIFDVIHKWAKQLLEYENSVALGGSNIEPVRLFVTGNGGVGKSFLLNVLYLHLNKLLSYKDPAHLKVLKMAPTGVASIRIEGQTFYTALSIPIKCKKKVLPQLSAKKRDDLRMRLSKVRVLMIDEISMLDQFNLEHISQRINEIFGCPSTRIFGNLTVILSGDLLQLPPIGNTCRIYGVNKHNPFLSIDKLWDYFKIAELTETVRQTDHVFVDFLNNCRVGELTDDDIALIKSRHVDNWNESEHPTDAIHIYAENKFVDEYNAEILSSNPNRRYTIPAIDKVPSNVKNFYSRVSAMSQMKTGGLATVLTFSIGSCVMITVDIFVVDRLVNGQIGVIAAVDTNDRQRPNVIYVCLEDKLAGLEARRTSAFAIENECVPLKEEEVLVDMNGFKFKRINFPIMLASACTVHKLQGYELSKALVSFDLHKQRCFNYGQMYVALSRVRTLNGLYISGDISEKAIRKAIRADPVALKEYDRLRREACFDPVERFENSCKKFVFAHLNVRGFNKHSPDIERDSILTNCDIILLSETQLLNGSQKVSSIDGFSVYFHSSSNDKFSSLAVCYKPEVNFECEYSIPGAIVFSVCKPTYSGRKIRFLGLYRKHGSKIEDFSYVLSHLISNCGTIDVIMGDFNMNHFDDIHASIVDVLAPYDQLVKQPTQISGGLLDPIYVRNGGTTAKQMIRHLYFTDHDATIGQFSKEE